MLKTMKAAVVREPGGPSALKIERRPVPQAHPGQVLIRVQAFGLNRSELFTRQGHSPSVSFPRVLGIEAVGIIAAAPGGEFPLGTVVATVMGGMGRNFDGSYAEYTCVPARQVQALTTGLSWERLGAFPEMLQTAWGALFSALQLQEGESLLIRGGTTSVGLAAAALAQARGASVIATTRNPDHTAMLRANGARTVLIDVGHIAPQLRAFTEPGADKVLELVGTTTLADSLLCARAGGTVCMAGMVGNSWSMAEFSPMDVIPSTVHLTTYSGDAHNFMRTPLQQLITRIETGSLKIPVGPVYRLDDIVDAHRCMEENRASGKIVVLP